MKNIKRMILAAAFCAGTVFCTHAENTWHEVDKGSYKLIINDGGATLGIFKSSVIKMIDQDGYAFKDLNQNGALDAYEDWRLSVNERADDLASRMSIEQIAGLMLYNPGASVPEIGQKYNGKKYTKGDTDPSALSDFVKWSVKDLKLRHFLIRNIASPSIAAKWNNNVQALAEEHDLGIPLNNSSDPRHTSYGKKKLAEFVIGASKDISKWPRAIGLAASFDPELVKAYGSVVSSEYRAMGIPTALHPQVDLATEPRWYRFPFTYGEDPKLATDMSRAYIDGLQTTRGAQGGWGDHSVNAMVKHWPGGGSGEAGRDAHFGYGAFGVFPGNNLNDHLKPFVDGAFKLNGGTGKATAVMPYYTVSFGQDTEYGENVGNGFSKYLLKDMLRGEYGYDEVICSDWGILWDHNKKDISRMQGKSWGVEKLTPTERALKAIMAGVDQIGGSNDPKPVIGAFEMGVKEYGKEFMRKRFEQSAARLLRNIYRVGLFENPYLDPVTSSQLVGSSEFMTKGLEAQKRSVIMLKNNNNALPVSKKTKVYLPNRWGVNRDAYAECFDLVPADQAEVAIVDIDSPSPYGGNNGYDVEDRKKGGNGYMPISLQYAPYAAHHAREKSMAHGIDIDGVKNRSYKGKSTQVVNADHAQMVRATKAAMKGKPVVVVLNVHLPMVFSEVEPFADAILVHFNIESNPLLDVISGGFEPSGLLPYQMPANMRTVEEQFEDVPRDMECYKDTVGHVYDFAFGMNWSGVINDKRVKKYK
jgi:beta-glucosidase